MYKKLAILIIVIFAVVFFISSQKTSLAQTPTTINYWSASTAFSEISHPRPSFIAGNYYYVLLVDRKIAYAKIKTNGSLDSWQIATAQQVEGDTRPNNRGYAAVVVNNVPYLLRLGRVEKLVINSTTGDVTEIQQVGSASGGSDSIGGNKYYWNSAVVADFGNNTYVYSLGGHNYGGDTNNQIYRSSNTSSTQWQWQAMGEGAHQNPYKAAFYKPEGADYGYIYVGDLHTSATFNPAYPDNLYRVKVKSDGTFDSAWILTASLPQKDTSDPHSFGEIFVSGSTLFVTRGRKVYSATISDLGTLTAWNDSPVDLPDFTINKDWGPSANADHTDGNSVGIKNNFVYITGKDKVYYSQIGGTAPSTSPNPTATTGPAPTLAPCPDSLTRDSKITFSIQTDIIKDINVFNVPGLKLVANNLTTSPPCKLTIHDIEVKKGVGEDYVTKNQLELPHGNYSFVISGQRNLKQQFDLIKLAAGQTLLCEGPGNQGNFAIECGDIGYYPVRSSRKLFSGDANSDNVINTIDFELYRQKIGSTSQGNNADFDYNGKVQYNNGTDDDFEIFKNNFGKAGVSGPTNPSTPAATATSTQAPTTNPSATTFPAQLSGTITGTVTIRANNNPYINVLVGIWDWPPEGAPEGEHVATLREHADLVYETDPPTDRDQVIRYTATGLTDGTKYIISPHVIKQGGASVDINPQTYCSTTVSTIPDPVFREDSCPLTAPGTMDFTITIP